MGVTATAWTIDAADGSDEQVRVERLAYGVRVNWFCGERRELDPDATRRIVMLLDRLPNVNVLTSQTDAPPFYGRVLNGGVFVAGDRALDDDGSGVLWDELKDAIETALEGVKEKEEAQDAN